jgi:hypothetical protein
MLENVWFAEMSWVVKTSAGKQYAVKHNICYSRGVVQDRHLTLVVVDITWNSLKVFGWSSA